MSIRARRYPPNRRLSAPLLLLLALAACGGDRDGDDSRVDDMQQGNQVETLSEVDAGIEEGPDAAPAGDDAADRDASEGAESDAASDALADDGSAEDGDGTLADDQGAAPPPENQRSIPAQGENSPPAEARLTRLTQPGCCTQAWWGPDSDALYYIDQPAPDAATGIYASRIDAPGAAPELLTDELGYYSNDMSHRFEITGDTTTLERRSDGHRWEVPGGGRSLSISPSGQWVLWQVSNPDVDFERRQVQVWVARIDGSQARQVASLQGVSPSGWIDDQRILVQGEVEIAGGEEDILSIMQVSDGSLREIARASSLRGELISPGGSWIVWYVAREDDPAITGIWILSTEGGEPRRLDKAYFGAYQWRDDDHLLVVPMQTESGSHRLYQVDAASLTPRPLTDPEATPFKIANGDWAVAPDGRRLSFVESRDKAIWVMELPQ